MRDRDKLLGYPQLQVEDRSAVLRGWSVGGTVDSRLRGHFGIALDSENGERIPPWPSRETWGSASRAFISLRAPPPLPAHRRNPRCRTSPSTTSSSVLRTSRKVFVCSPSWRVWSRSAAASILDVGHRTLC